ncbi:ClpX C4-type zinc finger protein [Paraburkholderia sp. SIMBA_050]|uniref:ClpX C4-type zinc finger n=1 Tax=Paraburkholderia terricola TaxID=169427 RepID=A0A1M6YN99_9BURK|nr:MULTISPECIES: ClpX C4-type zinc finger protein [Paraburkholderia]SDP41051.1 ClpX C4-type zinc finger [Paraburkholderia sediminicola]SHL19801.1 ClpX C4-type zinc finger [Paraburkholderia terricola]
MKSANNVWLCDFCGKNQYSVEMIVAGRDDAAICDECIDLSKEIVDERRLENKPSSVVEAARGWARKLGQRR